MAFGGGGVPRPPPPSPPERSDIKFLEYGVGNVFVCP